HGRLHVPGIAFHRAAVREQQRQSLRRPPRRERERERSRSMKRAVPWMLVLPALTAITSTASGANHQLCFYVDKTTLTGHTFACFMPKGAPQAGQVLCRGKYAAGLNIFGGPGKIKNDGARHWDQRICYVVTAAQYNGAAAKVNGKQAVPPPYHLVKNPPGNCTNW